jgi:lipopolysaccharide transport system ATP-binding protein
MSVALAFARVSKQFILQHERPESLQERFVQIFRPRPAAEQFWALRDVTFEVEDGETFGILGRNGAGKSTLLKLATGILQPTTGQIRRHRRTYAMLELGAGFHPELSGRDNIFLNGSIHGLGRDRMRAMFDQIVDFAELEQFIDTPVKHYSSGMFMRLGFATAIHMDPELLVIDEILAVGDAAFRRKCNDALWALKRRGVTILFVSHNEEAVYQFCDRALLLSHGHVAALGPTDDVVTAYARLLDDEGEAGRQSHAGLTIHAAAVLNRDGLETLTLAPGEPWAVEVVATTPAGPADIDGEVTLQADTGSQVVTAPVRLSIPDDGAGLRHLRASFDPTPLHAGRLRLIARLTCTPADGPVTMDEYEHAQSITVGGHGHGPLLRVPHHWADRTATPPAARGPRDVGPLVAAPLRAESGPTYARYLAEAFTGPDCETIITLVNPTAEPCRATLAFHYAESCAGPAEASVALGPGGVEHVDLAGLVGRGKELSVQILADQPIVAERSVAYRTYPGVGGVAYNRPGVSALRGLSGGHVGVAAASPAAAWHFAEGYTGPGFEVYFAIQNPNPDAATVTIAYLVESGDPVVRTATLDGRRRRTIAVHDAGDPVGLGAGQFFAASLTTDPATPIVVERVAYFRYAGAGLAASGASVGLGAPAPELAWSFAAGGADDGADEYLLLLNPGAVAAEVRLTYFVEGRVEPTERRLPLPPHSRRTVVVHDEPSPRNPAGLGRVRAFGAHVASSEPIVVERAVYVRREAGGRLGRIEGGYGGLGVDETMRAGQSVVFAPAAPGDAVEEELAIVNLGATAAELRLSQSGPAGERAGVSFTAPARRRVTVPAPAEGAPDRPARVSVITADAPGVVVEWVRAYRRDAALAGVTASFGSPMTVPATPALQATGGADRRSIGSAS